MPYNTDNVGYQTQWDGIEAVREQVRMLGASGRIADIIGKVGYRKLIEELDKTTHGEVWHRDIATNNLKLLHAFIGMLVKLIEDRAGHVPSPAMQVYKTLSKHYK